MSKANILVVDDQESIRHFVSKALSDEGYAVQGTGSLRETRQVLEHDMPDLGIFDLKLPDGTGIELLRELKLAHPEVPVILMTAFGEIETAVEAMSAGAYWFVKKPFQNEELLALAARALESQKMWLELRRLRNTAFTDEDYLHSSSPRMQECYAIAEQVARGDTTSVLIEGESGTGKEYFANLIHRMSGRHDKPFVEINCAAIPSELLESELFGHEKGAFTDARAQKQGLLELANGGTLFLDEIGEMSADAPGEAAARARAPHLQAGRRDQGHLGQRAHHLGHQRRTSTARCRRAGSARTSTTGSRSCPSSCRRCASAGRTSCRSRACSWTASRASSRSRSARSGPRPSASCSTTPGRATSASSRTCSSAPCCSRPASGSSRTTSSSTRGRAPDAELTVGQRVDEFLNGSLPDSGIPFETLVEQVERSLILRASYATNWNQSKTAEFLNLKRDKLRYRMKLYQIHGPKERAPAPAE